MGSWVENETAGSDLGDARLNRRLGAMLAAMGERPGKSLPTAFQDWVNTKAASGLSPPSAAPPACPIGA